MMVLNEGGVCARIYVSELLVLVQIRGAGLLATISEV